MNLSYIVILMLRLMEGSSLRPLGSMKDMPRRKQVPRTSAGALRATQVWGFSGKTDAQSEKGSPCWWKKTKPFSFTDDQKL